MSEEDSEISKLRLEIHKGVSIFSDLAKKVDQLEEKQLAKKEQPKTVEESYDENVQSVLGKNPTLAPTYPREQRKRLASEENQIRDEMDSQGIRSTRLKVAEQAKDIIYLQHSDNIKEQELGAIDENQSNVMIANERLLNRRRKAVGTIDDPGGMQLSRKTIFKITNYILIGIAVVIIIELTNGSPDFKASFNKIASNTVDVIGILAMLTAYGILYFKYGRSNSSG